MINANYHIVSPDAALLDPRSCDLVIAVGHRFFQYALVEKKKRIVALKFYQLPVSETRNWTDLVEDILTSDELLGKSINVAAIAYSFPENQLVPSVYYVPAIAPELLRLIHGDLQQGLMLEDRLEDLSMRNVYRVPADLHAQFDKKLMPERYSHYYSFWLQQVANEGNNSADPVCAFFYPGELLVMVRKDGVMQLVQQLSYGTAEDVSYHLLNIYQQFDLQPTVQPLKIGGMIETDSAMYEELLKYFLTVETDTLPTGIEMSEDLNGYPDHFFSPLLKIVPCVL